jgi:hypothetical protein
VTTDSNTNAAREKPMSIRECLDAVHKAGGHAWDKVADPDGFIRWMRGSDDPKDVAAAEQAMQSMPAQSPASAPEQASVGAAYKALKQSYAKDGTGRPPEYGRESIRKAWEKMDAVVAALSPGPSDVREQQAEQGDGGVNEAVSKVRAARERVADRMTSDCKCDECNYVRVVDELLAALTQPPRLSEDGRLRWISVKDRLPEAGKLHLLATTLVSRAQVGSRTSSGVWLIEGWCNPLEDVTDVTHWMPLPAPPAPATKGEEGGT